MCRYLGWRLSLLLLLAFGAAILCPALESGFELPSDQHYDGDGDDAGLVGKIGAHGFDAAVIDSLEVFIPSAPTRCLTAIEISGLTPAVRAPIASRGPPV